MPHEPSRPKKPTENPEAPEKGEGAPVQVHMGLPIAIRSALQKSPAIDAVGGPSRRYLPSTPGSARQTSCSTTQCVGDGGADSIEADLVDFPNVFGEHRLGHRVEPIAIDC